MCHVCAVHMQGPGTVDLDVIDASDVAAGALTASAAREHFRWLSQTAARAGVTVDVWAVGSAAANTALLAAVPRKSGGLISIHEGKSQSEAPSMDTCRNVRARRHHTHGGHFGDGSVPSRMRDLHDLWVDYHKCWLLQADVGSAQPAC